MQFILQPSPPDSPQTPFGGFSTPSHIPSFNSLWGHSWFLLGGNGSPTEPGPSPCFYQTFEVLAHVPAEQEGVRLGWSRPKKSRLWVSMPSRCARSITLTTKMCALWPPPFVQSSFSSGWHLKKGGDCLRERETENNFSGSVQSSVPVC